MVVRAVYRVIVVAALASALALAMGARTPAAADELFPAGSGSPWLDAQPFASDGERKPVVGFRMRGDTKVSNRTGAYLSHVDLGELVGPTDLPRIRQAFLSSELFEKVEVALEDAPGGVVIVATVVDKHSWIAAPTFSFQTGARAFGIGFIENNLAGLNQKLLFYGQLGDRESLFFGTYLDPSVRGTPLTYRFDLYAYRRVIKEYQNPVDDPTDDSIARTSVTKFIGGGVLVGWRFAWWLIADLRVRGAHVAFDEARGPDKAEVAPPEKDGWDVSAQTRLTLDARHYLFGVRWGPYVQLMLDNSIPGLDDYGYDAALLRAYYSWRLFQEHQLEVRGIAYVGRHLPFHEEVSLGSIQDLRGYHSGQFRGDLGLLGRVEYSVPLVKWRMFAFRVLGFWDSGYAGLHNPTPRPERMYLPGHTDGTGWRRSDVGGGLRVYVKKVVLPLLGFDIGYGIEARSPQLFFQLGLTDF